MTDAGEADGNGRRYDRDGYPVNDPTRNVLDLVEAAVKRQDDLTQAFKERLEELQRANDKLTEQRDRRQDDLRHAESEHFKEIQRLVQTYEDKLREAESKRIDAIRTVDVGAVSRAAEVSSATAITLANQVSASAETLRTQVSAAATQAAAQLATALIPITESIAELRRLQYEQQGQKAAQTESRGISQWAIVLGMGALFSLVEIGLHFLPVR